MGAVVFHKLTNNRSLTLLKRFQLVMATATVDANLSYMDSKPQEHTLFFESNAELEIALKPVGQRLA